MIKWSGCWSSRWSLYHLALARYRGTVILYSDNNRIESFSTFSSFNCYSLKFSVKYFKTIFKDSINCIDQVSYESTCVY